MVNLIAKRRSEPMVPTNAPTPEYNPNGKLVSSPECRHALKVKSKHQASPTISGVKDRQSMSREIWEQETVGGRQNQIYN